MDLTECEWYINTKRVFFLLLYLWNSSSEKGWSVSLKAEQIKTTGNHYPYTGTIALHPSFSWGLLGIFGDFVP